MTLDLRAASAPGTTQPRQTPRDPAREASLRAVATEFEATFLAQMLQHAGAGRSPEGFGGGAGEDAFASMLTAEHARLLAGAGGVGLADAIFASLLRSEGGAA